MQTGKQQSQYNVKKMPAFHSLIPSIYEHENKGIFATSFYTNGFTFLCFPSLPFPLLNTTSRFRLTPEQAGFGLQQFSVKDTIISSTCPAPPPCGEKEKYYRTIDGSCNNLDNPSWGQARTTFQRLKPPKYSDGK